MARRSRSIDRSYRHNLTLKPLIPCYWQNDALSAETHAAAGSEPVTVEPEPLAQLVAEAVSEALVTKKRLRKRDLIPEPSGYRVVFNTDGEGIGLEGPDKVITPLRAARK